MNFRIITDPILFLSSNLKGKCNRRGDKSILFHRTGPSVENSILTPESPPFKPHHYILNRAVINIK